MKPGASNLASRRLLGSRLGGPLAALATVAVGTSCTASHPSAVRHPVSTHSATASTSDAMPAASPPIAVINETGYQCAAKYTAKALERRGFVVNRIGNGDATDDPRGFATRTVIRYPASLRSQAVALAKDIPGAGLEVRTDAGQVILVLGTNDVTVPGVNILSIPGTCGLT